MNWMCPICNGFHQSALECPCCGKMMQDEGRISDYTGDYSPYRPIDDLKLWNGFPDDENHQCLHYSYCSHCQLRLIVLWDEKNESDIQQMQTREC